jgi:hypothetical protein
MALKDADLDVAISDTGSTKDVSWDAVQKIEAVDMDMGEQTKNTAELNLWGFVCLVHDQLRPLQEQEAGALKPAMPQIPTT